MEIALVRDILDSPIVDRDGEPMGCVDGLVMTWSADAPPRVTHLELGGATLARRLPQPLRQAMAWLVKRLTPRGGEPYRIEVGRIVHLGRTIKVDLALPSSAALASERWVRDHIIARIPGS
jgi:hypothetical protein